MLKLDDGRKVLYQWDVGVTATVVDNQITQVHFSNLNYGVSFSIEVVDGKVLIPPEVLQSGADVYCWAYVATINGSYTKKDKIFSVIKRPKPSGYIYTPTDIETLESVKAELFSELDGKLDISKVIENLSPEFAATTDTVYSTKAVFKAFSEINLALDGLDVVKESKDNKVTEIGENSTHEQYASAKAIYNFGENIKTEIMGSLDEISSLIGGA